MCVLRVRLHRHPLKVLDKKIRRDVCFFYSKRLSDPQSETGFQVPYFRDILTVPELGSKQKAGFWILLCGKCQRNYYVVQTIDDNLPFFCAESVSNPEFSTAVLAFGFRVTLSTEGFYSPRRG